MSTKPKGKLIIIGGHEDKHDDPTILRQVARTVPVAEGALLIVTVASQLPEAMAKDYTAVFQELGVKKIDVLDIRTREEAKDEANLEKILGAATVFFTGGDQLRITSQIGDTPVFSCMREMYHNGGTIVGTSAGAAAMPETMLIGGAGDQSHKISALQMAPGLGFLSGVVIDSHFAERGRMGRILGAVAQNPKNIGLGIDEDTAIVVAQGQRFEVIGSGAIYVVDGTGLSYSSLSEQSPEGILTILDVKLHVLGAGDHFDLSRRRPVAPER